MGRFHTSAAATRVSIMGAGIPMTRIERMPESLIIRSPRDFDFQAWLPLWNGYNAFYGREGPTALAPEITKITWARFLDPQEPVFALIAEMEGKVLGLVHYLYHRSTTRIELTCYLQDLFTVPAVRGRGIGRSLIEAVYEKAKAAGIRRVYWQTHHTNTAGRRLYDTVAKHQGFIVYSKDVD